MATVNMHEAKTHFSKLVARVEQGESITIARSGKAVARVVPLEDRPKASRRLGFLKGLGSVPDDWKELGRDEIEAMFEARK